MKPVQIGALMLIVGALVLGIEFGLGTSAALLLNIAVLTAVTHGCITLVAVSELCKAKWTRPVKKYLLSVYPLFLLSALLFAFLYPQWESFYGKAAGEIPNWMSKPFFFARNLGILIFSFGMGWLYSRESLNNGPRRNMLGVFYVLTFVITNSMIAFDWIMPLEYPWFSTLFGGFFFIESLYMGLVCSAFCCLYLYSQAKDKEEVSAEVHKAQYDTGIMLFGFGILWCYLFFSQFIVQWYGNLPSEVIFFMKRVWGTPEHLSTYFPISVAVVMVLFVFPFTVLQFKKVKSNPYLVAPIASVLFLGFILERFLIIHPSNAHSSINIPAMGLELVLILISFVSVLKTNSAVEQAKATA